MKIIVDGNGLTFRACASIIKNPLINAKGQNITGLYTFIYMLRELIRTFDEAEEVTVCWDSNGSRAKTELHPEYKATREDNPYTLAARQQIPIIQGVLNDFGVKQLQFDGIEADDVIGVLAQVLVARNHQVLIDTSDKDMVQLINNRLSIFSRARQKTITASNFEKIIGIRKDTFIDYLAMLGDTSDNIIGINGIGEKFGKKLVNKYGTTEAVVAVADQLRMQVNLKGPDAVLAKKALLLVDEENQQQIDFNKKLIRLGFLLSLEEKKLIITEYCKQNQKFNIDAVKAHFNNYQLIEYLNQIKDFEHTFGGLVDGKQTTIFAY